MAIDELMKTLDKLDDLEKRGWDFQTGLSHINSKDRYDDLIARDTYKKKFPNGTTYDITIDRLKIEKKKTTSSLPDINSGPFVDDTAYYRLTGTGTRDGKVLLKTSKNIFSENKYLDSLKAAIEIMYTLENEQ